MKPNEQTNLLFQALEDDPAGVSNPAEKVQGRMQELTPQLREELPVINRAREKRGKLQGVADYFSNEKVQMALLSFARAFDSREGSAASVLADAGESMIRGSADQRALAAAESGEAISEAGGTFADPDLVAGLQGDRERSRLAEEDLSLRREEFKQGITEFEEKLKLETAKLSQQAGQFDQELEIKTAQLTGDLAFASARTAEIETRTGLLEQQAEATANLQEAQAGYYQALAAGQNTATQGLDQNMRIGLTNVIDTNSNLIEGYNSSITQLRRFRNSLIEQSEEGPGFWTRLIGPPQANSREHLQEIFQEAKERKFSERFLTEVESLIRSGNISVTDVERINQLGMQEALEAVDELIAQESQQRDEAVSQRGQALGQMTMLTMGRQTEEGVTDPEVSELSSMSDLATASPGRYRVDGKLYEIEIDEDGEQAVFEITE